MYHPTASETGDHFNYFVRFEMKYTECDKKNPTKIKDCRSS